MTARITVTLNGHKHGDYLLDRESMTIGRKPDNDIHIDNLAVSGRHAQIITILNDSFLEDLNSTNGTYVNGALIKKHALKDGDVIGVGKHQLKFVNDTPEEKTMVIRPDAAGMPEYTGAHEIKQSVDRIKQREDAASLESSSLQGHKPKPAQSVQNLSAKLQVLNGANAGRELELTKALTTIGKPSTQVAAITKRPQGYFIIHVEGGPNNQTPIINGDPIGTQATALNHNDVIEVASVKMEFIVL